MEQLYCGIDLGTTNLKVLICDAGGRVISVRSCPTPRHREGGEVLSDPAGILSAIETLLGEAWSAVAGPARIAAAAAAGVGEDGFLLGADGAPRGLSIPWFDRRAEAEARELSRDCDVTDRGGIGFDPTRTAAKWLWLARNDPGFSRGSGAGAVWVALTDWPLLAWSGEIAMTEALAARSACWDIARHQWIEPALRAAQAPPLPPVRPTGTVIGPARPASFPVRLGAADAETRIVLGGHDHPIAAAAIRAGHPGAIVDSLGTAELIHAELPFVPPPIEGLVRAVPGASGMRSACLHVFELDRYLSVFPAERLRAEMERAGPVEEMAWEVRERLETAAMVAAEVLERMEKAGVPAGDIFVTGGRARSDRFMQLRANVLGRAIYRVEEGELSGLGAAITAAAGIGVSIVPDLAVRRFVPDEAAAARYAAERLRRRDEITDLLLRGPR